MGEIADEIVDRMLERLGFEDEDIDPDDDYEEGRHRPTRAKCRRCDESFTWMRRGGRWRPVDDNLQVHICKATASDFEVMP